MTALDTPARTQAPESETFPPASWNLVDVHATANMPKSATEALLPKTPDKPENGSTGAPPLEITTSGSENHGGIFSGITNSIKNLGHEIAADPVKAFFDYATPVGIIDKAAVTNLAGFDSDLLTGAVKELYNNPVKLAENAAIGFGVGALTAVTGTGLLASAGIAAVGLAGVELYRNSGNGFTGEINGAISDAQALMTGAKTLAKNVSTVINAGDATPDAVAAANQGIENVGAWVTDTAAFGLGSVAGSKLVGNAIAAAKAAGAESVQSNPAAAAVPDGKSIAAPPASATDVTPKPGATTPPTDATPKPGATTPPTDATPKPGATTPPTDATPKPSATPSGDSPGAGSDNTNAASQSIVAGSENSIVINGITVTGPKGVDLQAAVNSKQFMRWMNNLDPQIQVKNVEIQNVDMFGKNVGFVKFKADAINSATGKAIPGIVFARGDSVGILPVLVGPDNQEYAVMVTQPRVPIGQANYTEIPAGMQNPDDSIVGTAIKEIKEETGMTPTKNNLIDLGDIYPSPGGSDEKISLYALRQNVTQAQLDELNGRIAGVAAENEQTTVSIVPLESLRASTDAKAVSALARYDGLTDAEKAAGTTTFGTH